MKHLIALPLMLLAGVALAQLSPLQNLLPQIRPLPFEGTADKDVVVTIRPNLPLTIPGGALGHWGVGNGGDYLRIGFARAREYAAQVVMRITPNSLASVSDPVVRQWILDNQAFMAADILQTEHVWTSEAKDTCAWTVPPGEGVKLPVSNPIQFSYETCRLEGDSFLKVAQILIHESVHHFNGDETTADKVAIGIIDAWRSGAMDATAMSSVDAPPASLRHAAVWTGNVMIVAGGQSLENGTSLASVSAYNPRLDRWTRYNVPQNFGARHDIQAVWTGEQVLLWGGFRTQGSSTSWIFDGYLLNPDTGVFTPVAAPSNWKPSFSTWAVDPRQSLVWTGSEAIVWGGFDSSGRALGARLNPKTLSWKVMNNGSSAPVRIAGHSAVWTGDAMIVWGGYAGSSDSARTITQEGAIYHPADDSWEVLSTEGAPSARAGQQAVWTGKQMLVISGGGVSSRSDLKATGGSYDPASGRWTSFVSELLVERVGHRALWNGEELLTLGGRSNRLKTYYGEVFALNPETQRWRVLAGAQEPTARFGSSIVWTGSSALVWGGQSTDGKAERTGLVYYP